MQTEFSFIPGGVTAPVGFTASGIHCGIRKNQSKRDLALIFADRMCSAAAIYTTNLVKGAPIAVTRRNIENGRARAVICNSGNANTCNADGQQKAWRMCEIAAEKLGINPEDVIVASTGVIGQVLPIEPIEQNAGTLAGSLSADGSRFAAEAIMTTDTRVKENAAEAQIGGKKFRIGAIAKGSGMIHPNMATMLCFVTTDAAISADMLKKALARAAAVSFNMISVDGDTSTNDMVSVLASGAAGNDEICAEGEDFEIFCQALTAVCKRTAMQMARDGEGATKLVIGSVAGAKDEENAKIIAKSVICSTLLKAAMFGSDANWGRVLCAIGYSGADCDINAVDVAFCSKAGRVEVCTNGAGIQFSEKTAKEVLSEEEITIEITLHEGEGRAEAYGCDLTYDYVKINGDYRT